MRGALAPALVAGAFVSGCAPVYTEEEIATMRPDRRTVSSARRGSGRASRS